MRLELAIFRRIIGISKKQYYKKLILNNNYYVFIQTIQFFLNISLHLTLNIVLFN